MPKVSDLSTWSGTRGTPARIPSEASDALPQQPVSCEAGNARYVIPYALCHRVNFLH
jgi:hypothetical protein